MSRLAGVDDWSPIVDEALALLQGLTAKDAHLRYGFARETVASWRRRRLRGEPILAVRSGNRRALERLFDQCAEASPRLSWQRPATTGPGR